MSFELAPVEPLVLPEFKLDVSVGDVLGEVIAAHEERQRNIHPT